ncbi:MAG: PcfK-like family protein [Clostridiales bacterium]|nr:PcfK-like family protein [Clostridiales bacterium]
MGEVRHYTENGGPQEAYDSEHKAAVEEYLQKGYSAEAIFADCEIRVSGKTYNVLKRTAVTAFYDENGDTIFDVTNKRIAAEYEALTSGAGEPESDIGKAISSIERQAFEAATQEPEKIPEELESDSKLHDLEKDAETVKEPEKPDAVKKAVEKLQAELAAASDKEKPFAEPCIEYLIKRCGESQSLAEDICQQHKTWKKCYGYIFSKAKTCLGGNSGPVRSDTVFEWVEDYYHLDDKAQEEKKAKEAAERQKKAEERQKQPAKKTTKEAATSKKLEAKETAPKKREACHTEAGSTEEKIQEE